MFLALSVGQKLGLLAVAAVFIGFALASALLLPRARPDFPGRRGVRWFAALSAVLMLAMLTSMGVLAREEEEAHAEGARPSETESPGQRDTEPTREEEPGGGGGGARTTAAGNAAAGERVFAEAGCGGCHVLADAGSTGDVGPNLDEAKPGYELVVDRVTNGKGAMPPFSGQLSEKEIENVAAYVVRATGGG